LNTLVLEQTEMGEMPMDVYQKMAGDRILFLADYLDDRLASDIVATLLLKDNEDSEKTIKFDKYLIDDLDKYQLREVIEEDSNEADFVNYMVKDRYESMSAEEIIDEIYGDPREMEVNELYEIIKNYIDEDKFVEKWIKDEDFDFKKHFVIDNIYRSKKLQRNIFDNNPDRLLDLVELFDETKKWKGNENIGNEYDFQLKYIEKIIEKQKEEDQEYEDEPIEFDEKYESKLKASALEYLYDNFGLDPEIKTEFKKYLWRVIPKKGYNL